MRELRDRAAQEMESLLEYFGMDQGHPKERAQELALEEMHIRTWMRTGRADAQEGVPRCSYAELLEANQDLLMHPTEEDWRSYMRGYDHYEQKARDNGRTLEEQVEHDARGGDWVVLA